MLQSGPFSRKGSPSNFTSRVEPKTLSTSWYRVRRLERETDVVNVSQLKRSLLREKTGWVAGSESFYTPRAVNSSGLTRAILKVRGVPARTIVPLRPLCTLFFSCDHRHAVHRPKFMLLICNDGARERIERLPTYFPIQQRLFGIYFRPSSNNRSIAKSSKTHISFLEKKTRNKKFYLQPEISRNSFRFK